MTRSQASHRWLDLIERLFFFPSFKGLPLFFQRAHGRVCEAMKSQQGEMTENKHFEEDVKFSRRFDVGFSESSQVPAL